MPRVPLTPGTVEIIRRDGGRSFARERGEFFAMTVLTQVRAGGIGPETASDLEILDAFRDGLEAVVATRPGREPE